MASYVFPSFYIHIWWGSFHFKFNQIHHVIVVGANYPMKSTPQGFDNILCDYLHPRKFPVLGPILTWTVRLLTGGALYGLYEFNTNDIGMLSYDLAPYVITYAHFSLLFLTCPLCPQASLSSSRSLGTPLHRLIF